MSPIFPTAVYTLCFLTSALCAVLLGRSYFRTRARLLLWSALCFVLLALNNFVVVLDMLVVRDADLRLLRHLFAAAGVLTLAELLARTPDWSPPDLSAIEIVAQPHCHHAAVLGWQADAQLLKASGATVTTLGGCCGLAGNFGVEKGHYDVSVKVAQHDLLPAVEAHPTAVVLADGFSCRTQLAELAGTTAITLAELLVQYPSPPAD